MLREQFADHVPVDIGEAEVAAREAIALVSESAGTMAGKKEGGARPGEVGEILRLHGSLPSEDLRLLVRWGLFNWLFGNCNAQAKNISIIFDPKHGIRLAPFYDLVCTRVYKSLDRHLAMSIGEQFDPGAVLHRDLEAYALQLRVGSRLVDETVAELLATGKQRLVLAAIGARDGPTLLMPLTA
jgi:hypothetical protein